MSALHMQHFIKGNKGPKIKWISATGLITCFFNQLNLCTPAAQTTLKTFLPSKKQIN